jgi:hypothetical protein
MTLSYRFPAHRPLKTYRVEFDPISGNAVVRIGRLSSFLPGPFADISAARHAALQEVEGLGLTEEGVSTAL